MKSFAATLLLLYLVSSSGIVLVEYSCRESGTTGISGPASSECNISSCGNNISSGEITARGDDSCCDADLRVVGERDQLAGRNGDNDAGADGQTERLAASTGIGVVERTPLRCHPRSSFPGFDRPVRI